MGIPIKKFGFANQEGGAHTSRTMMLREMTTLLRESVHDFTLEDYKSLIVEQNILDKPTRSSSIKTLKFLTQLYGLSVDLTLFRVFRTLSDENPESIPQLAFTLAYCRDAYLYDSAGFVLSLPRGAEIISDHTRGYIEETYPGRFSLPTIKSLAGSLNSSWTYAGHFEGGMRKVKTNPKPTPHSACFTMVAGYLTGLRGELLLKSQYGKLVSATEYELATALRKAASRDLCDFKHSAGVTKVEFPQLLTPEEIELSHV